MPLGSPAAPKNETAFLLARNWDGFGGRLNEILNCHYVSQRAGIDFKFIWPIANGTLSLRELQLALSPEFRTRHQISPESTSHLAGTSIRLQGQMTQEEFLEWAAKLGGDAYISLLDPFSIPMFQGDTVEGSLEMYAEMAHGIWDKSVQRLRLEFSRRYQDTTIIHARYGDLVDGDWCQFVDGGKWASGLQIIECLDKAMQADESVEICSDSPETLLAFGLGLKEEPHVADEGPLASFSAENKRLLEDLFRLEASQKIYAPPASAFSHLGARLGGKKLNELERRPISVHEALLKSELTLQFWSKLPPENRGAFVSRDIDQYVNSLKNLGSLESFGKLTSLATEADPRNVTSLCHYQIYLTLTNKHMKAFWAQLKARLFAQKSLRTHEDPRTLVLITLLVCKVLKFDLRIRNPNATSRLHLRIASHRITKLSKQIASCSPYQISNDYKVFSGRIASQVEELSRYARKKNGGGHLESSPHGLSFEQLDEGIEAQSSKYFSIKLLGVLENMLSQVLGLQQDSIRAPAKAAKEKTRL